MRRYFYYREEYSQHRYKRCLLRLLFLREYHCITSLLQAGDISPAYVSPSQTFLTAGYFGIKPLDGRRLRGFSLTSLNGRERGYSLASQGGMTGEDVEMMERTRN